MRMELADELEEFVRAGHLWSTEDCEAMVQRLNSESEVSGDPLPPRHGRVGLMAVVGLQLVFARGAWHLSAGSVLGLLAFEAMAVVAAVAGDGALVIRGALAASALTVVVLLLMSISAFPSPDLPKIS